MPTQGVVRTAPHSALLRLGGRRPHRVLLDGGGTDSWGDGWALYADTPIATLTVHPSGWACWRTRAGERWRFGDPFAHWQAFLDAAPRSDGAGVLSVLSYDLKHWVERLPRRHRWPATPLLFSAHYDWSYRYDWRGGHGAIAAGDDATLAERVREHQRATDAAAPAGASAGWTRRHAGCPRPRLDRDEYLAMVARVHEYIRAGDVYQVNLAHPFTARLPLVAAPDLYAAWVERYPTPFAAYVDGGDWTLVSNTPECLLAVDGAQVSTFPIKGTRRIERGAAPAAVGAALAADAKENAEHVMIVDLERNDLGRVCATGSVHVPRLAGLREYPLLMHLESEVRGVLRPATSMAALLRASFPGGSITGAPKIRAMQIIEELEPMARGFYTGAIGWTDADGRSRFNLAIRTAIVERDELTYWAGGGIVTDSDAQREYAETVLKSETLFRALGSLERSPA